MRQALHHKLLMAAILGGLAFVLAPLTAEAYQAPWLDQVTEYVLMQKAITPEGTFQPYLDLLKVMRTTTSKGDWVGTYKAMNNFMGQLEAQAGGIPKETADAIWTYCYKAIPDGLHTEHEHIKVMGKDAYLAWRDRQELAEWHARHSF